MNDCERFLPALSAFVDGELDEAGRAELLAHLEGCADCRRALAELGAMREAFDAWEEEAPPADFAAGVLTRLHDEEKRRARRSGKRWAGLAACAAVVLLAVSALPGLTGEKKAADAATPQAYDAAQSAGEGLDDAAGAVPTENSAPALAAEPSAPAEEEADGWLTDEKTVTASNVGPEAFLEGSAFVPEEAEEPVSVLVVYGEGAEGYLAAHATGRTYGADGEPAEYILPPEELTEVEEKLDELGLSYEEACLPGQTFYVRIETGGDAG